MSFQPGNRNIEKNNRWISIKLAVVYGLLILLFISLVIFL
jgi:hypothetical protein